MNDTILMNYNKWINEPYFHEDTRKELEEIKNNEKEIEDRFYKDLEFGTGGLRGIIGAGTNRINIYTIRKATQGLADYIKANGELRIENGKLQGDLRCVIAYDSRYKSVEFAKAAALVLAANGIKAYLFEGLRSTPELSFAVRYLKANAGIVITASHNPKEYNGYKVYWEDGAQIATEIAEGITQSIDGVNDITSIGFLDEKAAKEQGLLVYLDKNVDDAYVTEVKKQSLGRDRAKNFRVVYTPLHGTGNIPVRRVLREIGFDNVFVVPEQELPDSQFSTVKYPNPEDKDAFKLAIELAKEKDAHIIIGTDPDCDRVGAVVKDSSGKYLVLTGNQTGALLVDYLLGGLKEKQKLPQDGVIIKTIVTSEMGANIAGYYGVETLNVLTGFKYIGEKIRQFDETKEKTFLFGYEESYGYLAGTYARDKDAVAASMLICEMAGDYYSKGMSLYDALLELYKKHGYYLEDLRSITLEGKDGLEKIKSNMEYFRENILDPVCGKRLLYAEDYEKQQRIYLNSFKALEKIELPKSNVIKLVLENGTWVCLRPSGTEPKLKIYCGVKGTSIEDCKKELISTLDWVEERIKGL
ncbi:MAG: phospho-sugar mutase [Tissierellales bacterium]